jgi:GT2 family glycosyltransferase
VVLDDDSYPAQDCFEKLVERFEQEPESTAILAFKVLNPLQKNKDCTENWPKEMITFWGCGAAIRKNVIDKFGGYNEDFFLYRNELEISIRLRAFGYKTIYAPELVAYHLSAPLNRTSERAFKYNYRNDIYIFWNYFPISIAFNYLAKIFFITFIKSIFKYGIKNFIFIWKPFFSKWWMERKYKTLKVNKKFIEFIENPNWREMNLIQPKLTDIPKRIKNKQIVY